MGCFANFPVVGDGSIDGVCCRSVGGIRVCLYNAITLEETERLAKFMREFQAQHRAVVVESSAPSL